MDYKKRIQRLNELASAQSTSAHIPAGVKQILRNKLDNIKSNMQPDVDVSNMSTAERAALGHVDAWEWIANRPYISDATREKILNKINR